MADQDPQNSNRHPESPAWPPCTFNSSGRGFQPSLFSRPVYYPLAPTVEDYSGWPQNSSPTNLDTPPYFCEDYYPTFFTPSTAMDESRGRVRKGTQYQLLPTILSYKEIIIQDLQQSAQPGGWDQKLARYIDYSLKLLEETREIAARVKNTDVHSASSRIAEVSSSEDDSLIESPFSHPLATLFCPPPRLRWIHPAIVDSALYALRKDVNEECRFEFTTTGDCGFENAIKADWLASVLGVFYYAIPGIRWNVAAHYCSEPKCWLCELSFVFRALDVAKAEGKGQPVRLNGFYDALLRSAPITLGLGPKQVDLLDPYLYQKSNLRPGGVDHARIHARIRKVYGKQSGWILREEESTNNLSPPATIECQMMAQSDQRRWRITRRLKQNEIENNSDKEQRRARYDSHFRCQQLLNYLLHSFGKGSNGVDYFQMRCQTVTECPKSQQATVVETTSCVLDLDHTPWLDQAAAVPPVGISCEFPTAPSLRETRSRPSSPLSSSSSSSCLSEGSPCSAPEIPEDPARDGQATPPTGVKPGVDFADLIKASLWSKREVKMVCKNCEGSHHSTPHVVSNQVIDLPPVLTFKVRVIEQNGSSSPNLSYWRHLAKPVHIPTPNGPPAATSHIYTSNIRDGDEDICPILSHWLRLRTLSLNNNPKKLPAFTQWTKLLRELSDPSRSPLPMKFSISKLKAQVPWQVSLNSNRGTNYDLMALIVSVNHIWSRSRRKCFWNIWAEDVAPSLGAEQNPNYKGSKIYPKVLRRESDRPLDKLMRKLQTEESMLECQPVEDQFVCFVRKAGSNDWLLINGPLVSPVSESDVRLFLVPWKYPCMLFYGQIDALWKPRFITDIPPAPRLPDLTQIFSTENISLAPLSLRHAPRFVPLSMDEIKQILAGQYIVAMDAEHVVMDILDKAPGGVLSPQPVLWQARLTILRAMGGPKDGTPFIDHYAVQRDQPVDYMTDVSGVYPGDLDQKESTHWLTPGKHLYQIMRFLVDRRCKFVGHDLFNDFRVLGIIVPTCQVVDTVEIFRQSLNSGRFLSLRFLCHHVLHRDIQQQNHDSVEDASAALELYRYYRDYVSKNSLEQFKKEVVDQLYRVGFHTRFKIPSE